MPYIQLGDVVVRLENEEPCPAVIEMARVQLREVPEIVGPAIEELRALVKGNNFWIFIYICACLEKNLVFVKIFLTEIH